MEMDDDFMDLRCFFERARDCHHDAVEQQDGEAERIVNEAEDHARDVADDRHGLADGAEPEQHPIERTAAREDQQQAQDLDHDGQERGHDHRCEQHDRQPPVHAGDRISRRKGDQQCDDHGNGRDGDRQPQRGEEVGVREDLSEIVERQARRHDVTG